MDVLKKWKKNIVKKTLGKCKTIKEKGNPSGINPNKTLIKSKSWPTGNPTSPAPEGRRRVAPGGCFSVYVGPEKERFVVKAKCANHPLFKMLLEEAEGVYGYIRDGPLMLPCGVDYFYKVLAEMDCESTDMIQQPLGCGYGSYALLSPSRLLKINQF